MARAADLSADARAFLDALAIGESAAADDDATYAMLYGGEAIDAPPWLGFPDWDGVKVGESMTHAAGRYQFEPATYDSMCALAGIVEPTFAPEEQDRLAWLDACHVYRRKTGKHLATALLDGRNHADIAVTLHSEWTSLSAATFGERFIKARRSL